MTPPSSSFPRAPSFCVRYPIITASPPSLPPRSLGPAHPLLTVTYEGRPSLTSSSPCLPAISTHYASRSPISGVKGERRRDRGFPDNGYFGYVSKVDTDAPPCHLVHHDLRYPPPPPAYSTSPPPSPSTQLFNHRYGPRHLLHFSDSAPPHLPAPPRSAVQTRAVLHRRRPARAEGQPQQYRVDALRVGHLLVSDGPAHDEGHDQLRHCDHRRHRPSTHLTTTS